MTPVNVGDVFKVTFVNSCDGQLGLNVKQFQVISAAVPSADLQGLLNGISEEVAIKYTNLLPNVANYRGCMGVPVPNLLGVAATISTTEAGPGTVAAAPLPLQVTGMVTLRTGLAGRANRGRIYVPFPTIDTYDADADPSPLPAYVALLNTLGSFFVGPNTITSPENPAEEWEIEWGLGVGGAFRAFTSKVARAKYATQRRRGNYGRYNEMPF